MFELGTANAALYLREQGYQCRSAEALGGGVSNLVLLADTDRGRFVLKQSLGKLRVEQDWFSDRDRIFREADALRAVRSCLRDGWVPRVEFEDRENRIFAMTAAQEGSRTWKALLLDGDTNSDTAETIAHMLAAMICQSWKDPDWERRFGDQTVFEQLRLDPYYRSTAARHPDLQPHFSRLIANARTRRVSLVHGDWSPKNFLVKGDAVMAIDFEVVHFGDPAFDSAFLINHLLLKSFHQPWFADRYASAAARFWSTLAAQLPPDAGWFEQATIEHIGGLLLARIDGKSPAEYIQDEAVRDRVRRFARDLIREPPPSIEETFRSLTR